MDVTLNPMAPDALPPFLPGPDGSDWLMNWVIVGVVLVALIIGNLYLRLHSMPERMAHGANSVQLQAVAALTLLALLTHNHILWLAALLIAIVRLPDIVTPLNKIAAAMEAREVNAPPAATDEVSKANSAIPGHGTPKAERSDA